MTDAANSAPPESDEPPRQRHHRQLIELLNELRVALPGVQVLFAFLLVVPFNQGFQRVTEFQRDVYFVTLLCTAASAAFLIAPSAYHRIVWELGQKHRILHTSNAFTIIGLFFLALAMTGVILLISAYLFGTATVIVSTTLAAVVLFGLWFAMPVYRRLHPEPAELEDD